MPTDNTLPTEVVRQIGPSVWTFRAIDEDVQTLWLVVVNPTRDYAYIATHIAADAMDAHDPARGGGSPHPLPYPDTPYNRKDIEQEAWRAIKYMVPGVAEGSTPQIELYQLVGMWNVYPPK
jgi:hypothetical protein